MEQPTNGETTLLVTLYIVLGNQFVFAKLFSDKFLKFLETMSKYKRRLLEEAKLSTHTAPPGTTNI